MIKENRNITYKRNIIKYLAELGCFCKKKPIENELLSLEETENIRNYSRSLDAIPAHRLRIGFDEKKDKKFLEFIESLYERNQETVYIWTPLTTVCGTYELKSLLDFDFAFEFDSNAEGIVVLLASNFTDKITLDFSVNDSGQRILDIDLVGDNWGEISYLRS